MLADVLLEIIKYLAPALVIFLLMRQFYRQEYALQVAREKSQLSEGQTGLRLQAYERLTLLIERIGIPELILRLQNEQMSPTQLQSAMIIAAQKEYEHNLTQQIYVSSELWQMINLLKDETIGTITKVYAGLESEDPSGFLTRLYQEESRSTGLMRAKVLDAIRKEVELYFK